jgi:hypothetical protein
VGEAVRRLRQYEGGATDVLGFKRSGARLREGGAGTVRLGQRLAAPHRAPEQLPDDAVLFDLLTDWVPDDKARHRVLVENPAMLYDFPKGG